MLEFVTLSRKTKPRLSILSFFTTWS